MSDNVPFEIQEEIIKRLPIKSLIQFRLVSKAWKSLISSSAFIADYSAPHPQLQHLLVRYDHRHISPPTYSSVVDDHTLPNNQRVSLTPPPLINWLRDSLITGSSHGLLCLRCFYGDDRYGLGTRMAVVVDGFCYWLATDRSTIDPGFDAYNLIISFHVTREEFAEVSLPESLVYEGSIDYLNISNLRESLVVLDQNTQENVCYVWSMKDGAWKSFTKLFTIYSPDATLLSVLEFRKSGEPVIEIVDNDADPRYVPSLLAIYEPKSKHISNLGFNGTGSFFVHSYKETLLLLDQPEFTVYAKGKGYIVKQRAEIISLLKHTSKVMNHFNFFAHSIIH
ncbi:putative F-box domain-containing protein [Helianthus annuus]|nr:putative F-box domain-containing protein [Helianthus annuus]